MRDFLPRLLATITRHPRYRVVPGVNFEWSEKSLTHNAFRLYEIVFGRREGIRVEATSVHDGNGTVIYCHTLEAGIAHIETYTRALFKVPQFKLVKVWVPMLAPVGLMPMRTPYFFAIAFDAVSNNSTSASQTATFSHTCTGSNLTLTVGCQAAQVPAPNLQSVSYNAVSATQAVHIRDVGNNVDDGIYYLANPATGANNIIVTSDTNPSLSVDGIGISLSGTATSPLGATNSVSSTGTSSSLALTTTAANSVNVDFMLSGGTPTATGSGQTSRFTGTDVIGNKYSGSTQTTTSTGSYTMTWSLVSNTFWQNVMAEIKPFVASANSRFLAFM